MTAKERMWISGKEEEGDREAGKRKKIQRKRRDGDSEKKNRGDKTRENRRIKERDKKREELIEGIEENKESV